jgi:diguanylate cyclase (GGDEF)-like protein
MDASIHKLIATVQDLSHTRHLGEVQKVVRSAARSLTGADGATFVLRDGDQCFYADEDAISPLWKGSRFPLEACISGWAMLNRAPAVIEDIYADERIPHDAYRPTFVKSLAMVPIRSRNPVGAIGNYWARRHRPSEREVSLLQSLADATSVAMESITVRALAHTDDLTRVNNRRGFFEVAGDSFAAEREVRGDVAVAFIDVDGLKEVNDEHGHDAGSQLIREVAVGLAEVARAADVVGRIGGDEFALLRPTGASSAAALSSEIVAAVRRDPEPARPYPCSVSVGVALDRADHVLSLDRLMAAADAEMYASKGARRPRVRLARQA